MLCVTRVGELAVNLADILYVGCGALKKQLIIVEAAFSEIGRRSKFKLLVAASFPRVSAAVLPGTSLCPSIHCRWMVLYNSANVERIVLNSWRLLPRRAVRKL